MQNVLKMQKHEKIYFFDDAESRIGDAESTIGNAESRFGNAESRATDTETPICSKIVQIYEKS